jgi:hypothetical protein
MALTDTAVKQAQPVEKPQKLFDGGGLYLFVTPEGGKYWRLKYRFGGSEKKLALGVYPGSGAGNRARATRRGPSPTR